MRALQDDETEYTYTVGCIFNEPVVDDGPTVPPTRGDTCGPEMTAPEPPVDPW